MTPPQQTNFVVATMGIGLVPATLASAKNMITCDPCCWNPLSNLNRHLLECGQVSETDLHVTERGAVVEVSPLRVQQQRRPAVGKPRPCTRCFGVARVL